MLICMRTTLNLEDTLACAAKAEAAKTGTTVTSLIEEGLRRVLQERATEQSTEQILALGRQIAEGLPEPWRTMDHGELLYDDHGLPR